MTDASDLIPGIPNLGVDDEQDNDGDFTKIERGIMPQLTQEAISNKGDIEKLARFLSELPAPDVAKTNFFGFLNQLQQYGFYDKEDMPLLMLFYDRAEASYINSVPSWEWTREHSLLLNNVQIIFYALIRQSVGTTEDVMNQRVALNAMRIQRMFGESGVKKRNKFLGLI